jgi:5-(carboxyamino)imidazole ribonucleotide synthase
VAAVSAGRPLPPGSVVGVLGAGQLGRMFAAAAVRMGYRVHVYAPDAAGSPAAAHAERAHAAAWDDEAALRAFATAVDAVTLEFENVPVAALEVVAEHVPVRPGRTALHVAQHRGREKAFLARIGAPTVAWWPVDDPVEAAAAARRLDRPALLKTAGFGYDGKGQAPLARPEQAEEAWAAIGGGPAVLEARLDLAYELSVVGARDREGGVALYPPIRNEHAAGILDVSSVPAGAPAGVARAAQDLTRTILTELELVGVGCVEFFVDRSGALFVNEIAPRPHNSGHLTIEAFSVSQFEQQLRALTGLPLARPEARGAAAMANLLGDLWSEGPPDWAAALGEPDLALHLYGKAEARPGRKMGHLTALARDGEAARERVTRARAALAGGARTSLR